MEVYTALVTPFTKENYIDFEGLIRLLDYQIQQGIDGVIVCGSTGECYALSDDERYLLYEFVTRYVNKKMKVILGVGSASFEQTKQYVRMANQTNCDAIMVTTPSYSLPTQDGIEAYYDAIIGCSKKNVIAYNVIKRCGVEANEQTIRNLIKKHDNFIGLKQANGNYEYYLDIMNDFEHFKLYGGDDHLINKVIEYNMSGIISVVSNAYPWLVVDYDNYLNGSIYQNILKEIKRYPALCSIKALLEKEKYMNRYVRLPLLALTNEQIKELESHI